MNAMARLRTIRRIGMDGFFRLICNADGSAGFRIESKLATARGSARYLDARDPAFPKYPCSGGSRGYSAGAVCLSLAAGN